MRAEKQEIDYQVGAGYRRLKAGEVIEQGDELTISVGKKILPEQSENSIARRKSK